tara:strand:+ start:1049 stop:2143 length:1095 start_codon:yes stop_codon:yes gene_type:complete
MIADFSIEQLIEQYAPHIKKTLAADRQFAKAEFTHDGSHIVTVGYDASIRLWSTDLDEPQQIAINESHQGWVTGLAVHTAEARVFTSDSFGTLSCFEYANSMLQPVWSNTDAHGGWVRDLALAPDGRTLVSASRDQTISTWDPNTGKRRNTFEGQGADIYTATWHPDSTTFATGDAKGNVVYRNATTGNIIKRFDAAELFAVQRLQDVGGVQSLTFSLDGNTLYAGGCKPNNGGNVQGIPLVFSFDLTENRPDQRLELGTSSDVYVRNITMHPDGFMLAVTNGNPGIGKLQLHRFGDEKPFYTNTKLMNCHHISLHPNKREFAVTTTSGGSNGNGRPLKDGKYIGSHSPVHILTFDKPDQNQAN